MHFFEVIMVNLIRAFHLSVAHAKSIPRPTGTKVPFCISEKRYLRVHPGKPLLDSPGYAFDKALGKLLKQTRTKNMSLREIVFLEKKIEKRLHDVFKMAKDEALIRSRQTDTESKPFNKN